MRGFANIKKPFRYEAYRFFHTPKFWVTVVSLLFAFIVFMFVNYFVLLPGFETPEVTDRQAAFDDMMEETDLYRDYIEKYADRMTENEIKIYKNIIAENEFYLNTQTLPSDYANDYYLAEKHIGRERLGFMFYFGTISEFVMWAVSIAACAFVFVYDYSINNYKNIYAGTASRKGVFMAKLLLSLALSGVIWILFFCISTIFGITDPWKFVICHKGAYRSVPTLVAFVAQYVGAAVIGLTLGSITILIGTISKKILFSIIGPFSVYLFCLLMSLIFADLKYANPDVVMEGFSARLPILCLEFHIGTFDPVYLTELFVHILLSGFALYFAYRISNKDIA